MPTTRHSRLLGLLMPICIAGSGYTTSAPDHSHLSISDALLILLGIAAIIGVLLYALSAGKRRRK